MTLYRESMRRLSRVGTTLFVLTAVASLIYALMSVQENVMVTSALMMSPVLAVYVFVGGAGLAFSGFSFLNKRVESDFYHSIPVRRADLYLSVTAAAATWMLFTIVIGSAISSVVYLGIGKAFSPLYPFMNAGFFFAAALLVFAAATIGCTITGTIFSNVILTCLVLLLPRYILFMIGRTIVADTGMVSWLDLRGFLDPTTNAATGLIVMLSRTMLLGNIVSVMSILWSLVLALVELAVGALLFQRRPSELAEQGAISRGMQIVFACLLCMTILLVYTVRAHEATTIFGVIILAAAIACYVIYQIIVMRSAKRVLLSLPWFLCAVAATAAIMFGSQAAAKRVLNVCPAAEQIASVRFTGEDRGSGPVSYSTLLVSRLEFTEPDVIQCVADTLRQNIDCMNDLGYIYADSNFQRCEPVCITLHNGRKIYRKLLFSNGRLLNEYRAENAEYSAAIVTLPPDDTVKSVASSIAYALPAGYADPNLNTPELFALCEYYFGEQRASGTIVPYYMHKEDRYMGYESDSGNYSGYTPADEKQEVGYLEVGGYIGAARYHDSISLTLETPQTCAQYMRLKNRFAEDPDSAMLAASYRETGEAAFKNNGGYFNMDFNVLNCPMANGELQQAYLNWYIAASDEYDGPHMSPELVADMDEFVEILSRGKLTDDPTRLSITPNFSIQYSGGGSLLTQNGFYLGFTPADEARIIEILGAWSAHTDARYTVKGMEATDWPASMEYPMPTPTPVPVAFG